MLHKLLLNPTVTPLIGKCLNAYTKRHKAIASNIANIEVPGFKRREVKFEKELKEALRQRGEGLCRTHPQHLPVKKSLDKVIPTIAVDESNPKLNAVNNVDIDMEMADMAKNQMNFDVMATVLRMEYQRLRMAIRGQ